ncbi:MAG: SEL1-like repeat protein [Succinivibrionaceae bacterium]|nr:SEL1-like repeat protein [Succinivibrionaceae bacterium]
MNFRILASVCVFAACLAGCGDDSLETISRTKTPEEIYSLAREYINGYDHEINHDKAIVLYAMAAERGYAPAEYMLANLYFTGSMVDLDMRRATDYFERAANHGIVEAQSKLAETLFESNGLLVDETVALDNLMKAAESDPKAMTQLAYLYMTGSYVRKDVKDGMALLAKAVEYKEPKALVAMSSIYINGDFGIPKDLYRGINLLQIAVAQPDNIEALIAYSDVYINGKGVAMDEEKGMDYLRQAAERNSVKAQYMLGRRYWDRRDYAKAVHWLAQAAESGMIPAQEQLGYLYANGLGVTQNAQTAISWYEKAANRGSKSARYQLAVLLSRNNGRQDRITELVKELREQAGSGDENAMKKLYYLYAGSLDERDAKRAEEYLDLIVKSGNLELMTAIARERFTGSVNMYADKPLAFRIMNQAAMSGYTPAQIQLADWYRAGELQNQDEPEGSGKVNAYVWYSLAAEHDGSARSSRRNIHLGKDEIRKAKSEIDRIRKEIRNQ